MDVTDAMLMSSLYITRRTVMSGKETTSPPPPPKKKMRAPFRENKMITLAYHNWNIWNVQILKRERKCELDLHC